MNQVVLTRRDEKTLNRAPEFLVDEIRKDFPILDQTVHGKPLVYLDNAATTQKPSAVIDALKDYYEKDNANVHRGVHTLSERATLAYESARQTVSDFINAGSTKEVVFTRGTTEAINLVASSYGQKLVANDEVIITTMEHHSNIVPWQLLANRAGVRLKVVPIFDDGTCDLEAYKALLNDKTKLVAIVHVSNALGTINPVKEMTELAHSVGAKVLLDGAQAVSHMPVDVKALDCDFYAFSGHKLFGPTGIGVLYGKEALLDAMVPYQGGGEMIRQVSFEHTDFNELPHKFEAGTPNIAGTVGLAKAIDYVTRVGLSNIAAYEAHLLTVATEKLLAIPGLKIIGTAANKASVASFVINGVHPHDLATILDHDGIAIRAGHHCAMPLMNRFEVAATARASFAFYNTEEEIERLVQALEKAQRMFA